ncbi:unnamed protein product [Hymenolepis diminuta]|uniref:Uncharacterized protein n=1 Tax=Hymenolepis diminuta TaxID=6216 RepID=A0A564Y3L1_HYMDI|nr:unnamed protein product [Hymenolepis diminuta]
MNFPKPDRDLEDYVKNFGEFRYGLSVGELFAIVTSDHNHYLAYFLPPLPKDLILEERIQKCEKVFGDNISLSNGRYKCLNLTVRKNENIHKYKGIDLCLACYAGIRRKLLNKSLDVMLHNPMDECNNFQSLIADSNIAKSSKIRT